jgi:hypothetical protein
VTDVPEPQQLRPILRPGLLGQGDGLLRPEGRPPGRPSLDIGGIGSRVVRSRACLIEPTVTQLVTHGADDCIRVIKIYQDAELVQTQIRNYVCLIVAGDTHVSIDRCYNLA